MWPIERRRRLYSPNVVELDFRWDEKADPPPFVGERGRVRSEAFVPKGVPLVVGIDETLERRWGKRISARGVYRYLRCAPPTRPS